MRVKEIKSEAKERFALNREHAMIIYGVVYTLALNIALLSTLLCVVSKYAIWYCVILIIVFLLLLAPFGFGMAGFYLKMYRAEKAEAPQIFDGFQRKNLERVIVLRLLAFVLWLAFTVLLLVPGIIFLLRTSMAVYLLRANPKLKAKDALKLSNKVMKGHTGKYFALLLSFIGWFLLGIITCGLGFIWVLPYLNAAKVVFYKRELEGDKGVYGKRAEQKATEELVEPVNEVVFEAETTSEDFSEQSENILTEELPNVRSGEESEPPVVVPDEPAEEPQPERVYTKPITVIYESEDKPPLEGTKSTAPVSESATILSPREPYARASQLRSSDVVHEKEPTVEHVRTRAVGQARQHDSERRASDRRSRIEGANSKEQRKEEVAEPEHVESVKERLERLRAERNASKQENAQPDEQRRKHERERNIPRER